MIESVFAPEARWLWTGAMTVALFFPIRKLIWVLTVRRSIKYSGKKNMDNDKNCRLFKRASFTAGILSFLFSFFYIFKIFTS